MDKKEPLSIGRTGVQFTATSIRCLTPESCRCGNGRYPLILCIFAFFATLGRVLQLFVAVKNLFTGGPNEMCAAVDAQY